MKKKISTVPADKWTEVLAYRDEALAKALRSGPADLDRARPVLDAMCDLVGERRRPIFQLVKPPQSSRSRGDPRSLGLTRLQAEDAGSPPSKRSVYEGHLLSHAEEAKAQVEWRRGLGEQAHHTRRPGQTLADAVRELEGRA